MRAIITVVFFSLFNLLQAQETSSYRAKVIDAESSEALIGASVFIPALDLGKYTEVDGSFEFLLQPGDYEITVSYVGYETIRLNKKIGTTAMTQETISLKASDLLLETATITGSKYERSVADAPVSISVLPTKLLDSYNTLNISDLLDKTPGVQMIDGQANIRGGSGFSYGAGSRVMLLLDETPALQVDAGRPVWADMPIENCSQVEVIKGASSVLYGSSAMNGIIHFRTGYATSEPETKVSLSYVNYRPPSDPKKLWWTEDPRDIFASVAHKQKFGKLDVVAHANYQNQSRYLFNNNNTPQIEDDTPMYNRQFRGGVNLRYRITDRTSISFNGIAVNKQFSSYLLWKDPIRGAYSNIYGGLSEGNSTRLYLDPSFRHYGKNGISHKIITRTFYIDNDNNNNQGNGSLSQYIEYQIQKDFQEQDLLVTAGISSLLNSSEAELFGDTTFSSRNFAIYAQVEKKFIEKLNVIFGVRAERNVQLSPEEFQGITIPNGKDEDSKFIARAAMSYPIGAFTFMRASFGQGYRYPTITERFITTSFGGFNIFSNPDLEPEQGWSSEIGVKQGFKIGGFNGYFDLAGFLSQYNNMMEFTFASVNGAVGFRSENVGQVDIRGFEANVAGTSNMNKWEVNVLAGYTFIDPTYTDFETNEKIRSSLSSSLLFQDGSLVDAEPENVLKYRSKHNLKGDIEVGYKGIALGLTMAYVSRVPNVDLLLANFSSIREYRSINNLGYSTIDLRVAYSYTLNKGLKAKLSLLGKNLLNKEYTLRPGLLEAPRNIGVRLDFVF